MIFDDVLKNPTLRRVLTAGEEQMGKVVGRLLTNERVTSGLQGLVSSALQARETIGRGVERALHAANLPSREDVAALRRKVEELEAVIDGLSGRAEPGREREREREQEPEEDAPRGRPKRP